MNNATNEPEKPTHAGENDQEEHTHSAADLPVKKQRSKKKLVITLVLLLLVIVLGVVVYFLVTNSLTPKETKDETGYASATQFASAKKLVEEVKPGLMGEVVDVAEASGLGGKTIDGYGAYGVPSFKVGDRKYKSLPADSAGAGYKGSSVEASYNYDALTSFFKRNKFKTVSSGKDVLGPVDWLGNDIEYVSYATYESSNLLCMTWHADASGTPLAAHVTSIGCSDKSSYEAAAKVLDEFFAAYTKDDSSIADNIVLGAPKLAAGADGYKNAVLYQEDPSQLDVQFEGLYYLAPGQKDWSYFFGSYGPLNCSDYNTDELKKAFKDFNCYNQTAQAYATVQ